jgi:hypothetical protein
VVKPRDHFRATTDHPPIAAVERCVHHGIQAAQLLDASGHGEAGDLIRAEFKARHGHMSALQAAGSLRDCALSPEHSTDRKDFA